MRILKANENRILLIFNSFFVLCVGIYMYSNIICVSHKYTRNPGLNGKIKTGRMVSKVRAHKVFIYKILFAGGPIIIRRIYKYRVSTLKVYYGQEIFFYYKLPYIFKRTEHLKYSLRT